MWSLVLRNKSKKAGKLLKYSYQTFHRIVELGIESPHMFLNLLYEGNNAHRLPTL